MRTIFPGKFKISQTFHAGHGGMDIVGLAGADIISPVNGTVKSSTIVSKSSGDITWEWGNYVRVDDANGNRYFFCHMASRAVKVGQKVKVGDKLGIMGNTGLSYGDHCHFEVRTSKNIRTNPSTFLGIPNRCGVYIVNSSEWKKTASGWTYGNLKNQWGKIDGRWYYFLNNGVAAKGTHIINGKVYAFASEPYNGLKECQLIETDSKGAIKHG